MGSPLGLDLANFFMSHLEEKWVMKSNYCPTVWFGN